MIGTESRRKEQAGLLAEIFINEDQFSPILS